MLFRILAHPDPVPTRCKMPRKTDTIQVQPGFKMKLRKNADIFFADFAQAGRLNPIICRAFARHLDDGETRRSHYFAGRLENIYMDREKIPEVAELLAFAEASARDVLRLEDTALRSGFWFNEMKPGQRTLPHTHDDGDELLSGVYYLRVPEGSGNLVILDGPVKTIVEPRDGMFVFFGPHVLHEVTANLSGDTRLSLAVNIGRPPESPPASDPVPSQGR